MNEPDDAPCGACERCGSELWPGGPRPCPPCLALPAQGGPADPKE